ncbi:hypothetical protein BH10ACT4_BH10ACT4_04880 [soil metagenome]
MNALVRDLEFPGTLGLYGRANGSGVALLHLASPITKGPAWARVDEAGGEVEPGYYYVRALAQAELPTGWWASILLYSVQPTLDVSAADKGTPPRVFTQVGEFEGAADLASARRMQESFEASRRERGDTA